MHVMCSVVQQLVSCYRYPRRTSKSFPKMWPGGVRAARFSTAQPPSGGLTAVLSFGTRPARDRLIMASKPCKALCWPRAFRRADASFSDPRNFPRFFAAAFPARSRALPGPPKDGPRAAPGRPRAARGPDQGSRPAPFPVQNREKVLPPTSPETGTGKSRFSSVFTSEKGGK